MNYTDGRKSCSRSHCRLQVFVSVVVLVVVGCGNPSASQDLATSSNSEEKRVDAISADGDERTRGTNERRDALRADARYQSPQFHPSKFRAQYDVRLTTAQDSQAKEMLARIERNVLKVDGNRSVSIESLTMRVEAPVERTTLIFKFAAEVPPQSSRRDIELLFIWESGHWNLFSGFSRSSGGRGQKHLSPDQVSMLLAE